MDAARELAQLLQRVRRAPRPRVRDPGRPDAGAPPAAASGRARRAAAARRRAGCAPAAGARRRPPRRCGRARRPAPRARSALASAWAASSAKSAIRCSAPGGERLGLDAGDDHRAPQAPAEEDRRGDGARRSRARAARSRQLAVEIRRSSRCARARRCDRRAPRRCRRPSPPCPRPGCCGPAARSSRPSPSPCRRVEAHHVRALRAEQPRDLLGHDAEHAPRVGRRRDRGRHAPQRGLLLHQPRLLALARLGLGHVAQVAAEQRRAGEVGAGDRPARPGTRCRRRASPSSSSG